MQYRRWDIFCQVIDNFGDAGIAWRLARQLAREHGITVRLWIDDLDVLQPLHPPCDRAAEVQYCEGVEVCRWREDFSAVTPAPAVIEAFGCRLPEPYLHAMTQLAVQPVWINLEYLSAEAWVRTHHGLASPHPSLPLTKYFFFPGYQAGTGGVLCERDLLSRRAQFQQHEIAAFWQYLGVSSSQPDTLYVSLFAYENPALPQLFNAWLAHPQAIICLVPEGRIVPQLAVWLDEPVLRTGVVYRRAHIEFYVLPFLDQDRYDQLLWACDLNFVRGEDSCVRAQWAARPLVWQAYPQQEAAHWAKIEALSALYTANLPAPAAQALMGLWNAWNGQGDMRNVWHAFLQNKPALDAHARQWLEWLAAPGDLAGNLRHFVEDHEAR